MSNAHKTPDKQKIAQEYLSRVYDSVNIGHPLGHGTDGAVWATTWDTAIKVFDREIGYCNERDTYLRLRHFGVTSKLGDFWIPEMIDFDDQLMVVEMDLMQQRPYIIDFAKVRLDFPPDFSERTLEDIEMQGRDLFGTNWPAVQDVLRDLESYQIYYLDPKPHNIVFPTSGHIDQGP